MSKYRPDHGSALGETLFSYIGIKVTLVGTHLLTLGHYCEEHCICYCVHASGPKEDEGEEEDRGLEVGRRRKLHTVYDVHEEIGR